MASDKTISWCEKEFRSAVTTVLHYHTKLGAHHFHVFYQGLYFLPAILSGFWFGLRGGLITSVTITLLYTPFTVMHWNGFSTNDFTNLRQMVLYNLAATIDNRCPSPRVCGKLSRPPCG